MVGILQPFFEGSRREPLSQMHMPWLRRSDITRCPINPGTRFRETTSIGGVPLVHCWVPENFDVAWVLELLFLLRQSVLEKEPSSVIVMEVSERDSWNNG
jgi:hypothetical protein